MAVQTVVQTIGATGRQFSTLALWEAALPVNLTTAEKSAAGTFSGSYTLGESLTFTGSGATGKFIETDGSTYIIYAIVSGNPAASDTVTGGTSGATCVLSSSTPTDVGVIMEGQCYNDAEFTVAGTVVTISGQTTSATCYVHLTTATGQSFRDNASVQSNALRYNQSNGVGIRNSANAGWAIVVASHFTRFSKLQITSPAGEAASSTGAIGYPTTNSVQDGFVEFSILEGMPLTGGARGEVIFLGRTIISNSLLVNRRATGGDGARSYAPGAEAHYCTVVRPSDLTAGGVGFTETYDTAFDIKNCAVFGFTSFSTNGTDFTGNNNAWTGVVPFGTSNQDSLTYADQFENTANATRDFRLKSGATLIGTGATDSPYNTDIAGTARSGSFDIGCWQFVSAGGGVNSNFFLFFN